MPIDRANIRIGPAKLAHDGATHFFEDGLTLTVNKKFVDVGTDVFGVMLKALVDVTIEVSGTPKEWANMAKLNPFASMVPGTLINGATDKPLVITPQNGKPLTLAAAAVKTPPNFMFSASKPMFGACTWCGVLANNTAWSAIGARYTYGADASAVALTGLTKANMALCAWAATLGGTAVEHEDGIAVDWNVGLTEQTFDSVGLVDYSFDGIEAMVKYVPGALAEADNLDVLAVQGTGVARGASAAALALVLTGTGGRYFALNGLVQSSATARYTPKLKRPGEVSLVSTRDHTTGALNAMFAFAA